MDIEKALRFPLDGDGVKKVIIGTLLSVIPIANFLSLGYFIEIMEKTIRDEPEMPAWENWEDKLVKGLVIFAATLTYTVIIIFLIFITFISSNSLFFNIMLVLCILITLALLFMLPMAAAVYADTRNFSVFLSPGTVFAYIRFAIDSYLLAFLLFIGLHILLIIAFFASVFIPFLGSMISWLVYLLGTFYIFCLMSFLVGDAYRTANRAVKVKAAISEHWN